MTQKLGNPMASVVKNRIVRKRSKHKQLTAIGQALARPGDPYVLPDGSLLNEVKDKDNVLTADLSAPTKIETPDPESFRPENSRVLKDISTALPIFNAAGAIFVYTMYGISDIEICDATKVTMEELRKIRAHRIYTEIFNAVLGEFVNSNSSLLQARIASMSHMALGRVAHLAQFSELDTVAFTASKDILDRSGARPEDLRKTNTQIMNELRIVVEDETSQAKVRVMHNGKDVFDDFQDFTIEEIEENSDGDRGG